MKRITLAWANKWRDIIKANTSYKDKDTAYVTLDQYRRITQEWQEYIVEQEDRINERWAQEADNGNYRSQNIFQKIYSWIAKNLNS